MGTLTHRAAIWLPAFLLLLLWTPQLCIATETGKVSWIYDGDTLKVDGIGKVRLIGIDTPEREDSPRDDYYQKRDSISSERLRKISRKALEFNIRQVKGKQVRLQFDRERQDKFGRTLAYIYLPDGTLLNRLLIEQGLASVYRRFDFRFKQDFLAAEEQARQAGIGLWAR
jgi:micrococcal nuclease